LCNKAQNQEDILKQEPHVEYKMYNLRRLFVAGSRPIMIIAFFNLVDNQLIEASGGKKE